MCNQTVCLIAAELERRGITTVCLAFVRHVVEKVRPPRALIVPFAHGYPLDVPKDAARQRRVLARALALAECAGAMPPLIEEYAPSG